MKQRRVMKLLSLSMAGVLMAASCDVAGTAVYASEPPAVEETDTQSDKASKEKASEEEGSKEESSEEKSSEEKSSDESSEDNDSEEKHSEEENEEDEASEEKNTEEEKSEDKDSGEKLTEEETTEEEPEAFEEELTEEIMLMSLADAAAEDVELIAYGEALSFDKTSDWDDNGKTGLDLGLSADKPLNEGAKVSFDIYIPAEAAEFEGSIKAQGAARLGDKWDWTESKKEAMPELDADAFTELVEIDGETYKRAHVSYTFGDEICADELKNFTVKLAGYQCDYEGIVYFANVKLEDGAEQDDTTQTVTLQSFYEDELSFDSTSTWDDKGESQLGLKTEQPLNKGAKVSFDIYIPEALAEYKGLIKVQGIARLGDKWDWTENEVIPEFRADDFTETAEIDGETYKKAHVSYTFGEEISTDYLAEFTVKLAGYECDYQGPVYYAGVKLEDGREEGSTDSKTLMLWDFEDDIAGWYYDGTWDNDGDNSVIWSEQYQALEMNVDYSQNASSTWSEIKTSFRGDDFKASGANALTLDFIYDADKMKAGSFKIKLFSNSGIDENAAVDFTGAEDYDGSLKRVKCTIRFDETDIEDGITLGIIGCETDYQGVVYLDNIALLAEEKAAEEDIYVDATLEVTGQEMQVSIEGCNTLTTNNGNSVLAQNITLADGDATDEAKQVYSYLKAVGETGCTIFGQQNNTSHKAGSANLSCSDTMDVVGSYAGVIGLDGLALTGNEYSADRYLSEMAALDSEYASVSAKINQASTAIEKNVIAAAALTNYNIRSGAIATLSLHMPNFSVVSMTGASAPSYAAYDFSGYTPNVLTGDVMNQILPGGQYNAAFNAYLDMVADYAKQVDGAILFRPFHENTGSWFWWGAAFCDAQSYKSVYKYTVQYLRDEKDVHNLLYVYGPGSEASSVEEYAERYPGDGYVDMVGFDMYHSNPVLGDGFFDSFTKELNIVQEFALAHGKLMAVTETGTAHDVADGDNQTALLKTGNEVTDWHDRMLRAVQSSFASYYLVWANFGEKDGFYTPYVKSINENGTLHGHEMMDDFIHFFNDDRSIFAVNQKQALEQMKSVSVQAAAAVTQDGYLVSPVSGSRVLEETALTAKVTNVTEEDEIRFVCEGSGHTCTLKGILQDGYSTAVLRKADLEALGEAVGQISLQINGETVDAVRVTFNIAAPEEDLYEIDGFENYYGTDALLTKAWATNKASGSTIEFSLVQDKVYAGDYALRFAYQETSDGWAGATISKEVSWADCDALSFWMIPDGKLQKTVIQITANGNVYEYYLNLNEDYAVAGTAPICVTIPFAEFVARDISGNPKGGLEEDKAGITSFGLWVNAIAGSDAVGEDGMVEGVLYYDSITAVSAGLETAKIVPAKQQEADKPSSENTNSSSDSSDEDSSDSTTAVIAKRVVQPSYVGADGVKVTGWDEVAKAAYRTAVLDRQQAQLTDASVSEQLIVNINALGVTELVVPASTVRNMAQTGAAYNIFMEGTVITLTNEILSGMDGSLDLELYKKEIKDFGEGFDALFLSSRTKILFTQKTNLNVVLDHADIGKTAYIYRLSDQTGLYEFMEVQTISEIGTVCIAIEDYADCLILY
ncbi:MAG: hypothetical protein J6D08_07590 [Lachnospiraceae bacterium]|nr:hypothetical protein [Lachnospiraceae bacterium]